MYRKASANLEERKSKYVDDSILAVILLSIVTILGL